MTNVTITRNPQEAQALTHGGLFHADEVLATVILARAYSVEEFKLSRVFKVPEDLPETVVVYDIGGGRFDHHQRGGNGSRENGVPYSSAGLIWREFGMNIPGITPEVWAFVDRELVQFVDAYDNGTSVNCTADCTVQSVSSLIAGFNPNWDETTSSDEAFLEAVQFMDGIFERVLKRAKSTILAREIVEEALEESKEGILILPRFVPWQDHLLIRDDEKAGSIQFVIFPALRGGYSVQAVPVKLGSRENRKSLPEAWRGLSGAELQEACGIKTAIFCHAAGFIGSAETLEDALLMAKKAIEA